MAGRPPNVSEHSLKVLQALRRVQPADQEKLALKTNANCVDSKVRRGIIARNGLALQTLKSLGYVEMSNLELKSWKVTEAGDEYLRKQAMKQRLKDDEE